jgi:hypothetical protein
VHEALLLRPARSDPQPDPPSHFVKEERGCRKERKVFFILFFFFFEKNGKMKNTLSSSAKRKIEG